MMWPTAAANESTSLETVLAKRAERLIASVIPMRRNPSNNAAQ